MSNLIPSAYQEWTKLPDEQQFSTIGSDGATYTATMEELTGGQYALAGRGIINLANHRFAGSINANSTSSLIVRDDGTFLLVNSSDLSGVTTFGKQSIVNAASIESSVTLPDGTELLIDVPYANINRIGKQLMINNTDVLNPVYRWADIGTEILPPDFRYATNKEAVLYGLSSALIRQYRSIVTQIADAGIEDENGNSIVTITDAAMFLARTLSTDGTYAHIFQLG